MQKQAVFFGKEVGDGNPTFVIADIGLNHNGSIEIAKELIHAAAKAGWDVAKFQKREVKDLAVKEVLDAEDNRFPEFGKTYREIREHLEFNEEQYRELIAYAKECGIAFMCTPFDIPSVDFLEKLGVEAYKVASHSLTNIPLLIRLASLGKPIVLSTGMATLEEVDQAVEVFKSKGVALVLLHCVSSYPTSPELMNFKLIDFYRKRYGIPVGYSGHELAQSGYLPTLGSIFLGSNAIERHITLDSTMMGFDHKLSIPKDQLAQFIKDIRLVESMLGTGEKVLMEQEMVTRRKYHVSIASVQEIKQGTVITSDMLTFKNPGTGIESYDIDKVVGKVTIVDIPADHIINWDMLQS